LQTKFNLNEYTESVQILTAIATNVTVSLKTTCIKNVKFKIIKTRTGCQYVGYFYHSENLNWAAQNLRLGRGLDIAALDTLPLDRSTRTHLVTLDGKL